ncbi:hypothetical protein [Mycobacteroides franklinii]|uniref:Uncharacterized protein n=1 Tax=Mycobacteroides franklinii TaxID=948102 RepID=A0A4V3A5Y1_9MYCO|nr:hypothetical protein [Mycobacteroides franklinii]TDH20208.1 hypothetical protein EJ571_15555 [Mycobacteroides franklinii]
MSTSLRREKRSTTTPHKERIVHYLELLILSWLIMGAIATGQRGYFANTHSCGGIATIALTVVAGPLNYAGLDSKATGCSGPAPSG